MRKLRARHGNKLRRAAIALAAALALAACTAVPAGPPIPATAIASASSPASDSEWTAKLRIVGGIMGITRTVSLTSTGELTVRDEGTQRESRTLLADSEMRRLAPLVASVQAGPSPGLPPCADCFVYDLRVEKAGRLFSVVLNDVNLDGSDFAPLVRALFDLAAQALPL